SMLAPVGGVSHVRVVHPLVAIGSEPGIAVQLGDAAPAAGTDPEVPRIFVLHRPILTGEGGLAVVRRLIAEGWVVVTEFDDHPDFLRDNAPGDDQFAFAGVHAVQTSTERLAQVLRARNPEVRVFPNAMSALPEPRNFADPGALTLFFGALNRAQDWVPLMPSINAAARAAGERLRFEVVHDQAFFDALQTPHKRFTPTCDYDRYLELLGGCEISLMPLRDNEFNRAKSDLKFIEAGACRVAALAAPVVYGGTIEDGRTGLLFADAAELHDRLLRLVAMPDLARALGDAARAYVAGERMLAYQVADRIAWYRDLWRRRNELTSALVLRLAGIRPPGGA
ncbi:MAG: glycosyltransferase, partial [Proteobacteria bacterium]|nr:glycosyltransferase [Pseudomonadota bacterium]